MSSIASRLSGALLELRQSRLQLRIRLETVHLQWLLIMATLLVIGVHLASLELTPPVFIDEPWYSDVAWTFLQTGIPFDSMFSGALDQWNAYWVRWQLLAVLPFSACPKCCSDRNK